MSSIDRSSTYIDTNVTGLVVQIQHNLGAMVYPFLWELDSGHKVHIPLFDPRIAELKALDDNTFQATFASAFDGYVDLLAFDFKVPSVANRIKKLEEDVASLKDQIVLYTTSSQWKQMNTFFESQISQLNTELEELQTLYQSLQEDVDAL